jgi:hypothetical protein
MTNQDNLIVNAAGFYIVHLDNGLIWCYNNSGYDTPFVIEIVELRSWRGFCVVWGFKII